MIYGTSGNALFGKEDELRRILELAKREQLNPDISFRANPANYRNNPRGNLLGDAALTAAELGGTTSGKYLNSVDNMYRSLGSAYPEMATKASNAQKAIAGLKVGGRTGARLAGMASKALPIMGTVAGVTGAADILMGKDSAANKAMDTAAMIGGATLCSPGGPLAMTACAGIAKSLSDGTQWLFGDKKSPEERRMEEALIALRGGQI